MTKIEANRLKLTKTLAEAHEMADRFLANARASSRRRSSRSPRATGPDKAAKREEPSCARHEMAPEWTACCPVCGEQVEVFPESDGGGLWCRNCNVIRRARAALSSSSRAGLTEGSTVECGDRLPANSVSQRRTHEGNEEGR